MNRVRSPGISWYSCDNTISNGHTTLQPTMTNSIPLLLVPLVLLLQIYVQEVRCSPLEPEILVNDETRDCVQPGFMGDEFTTCVIRYNWKSLGTNLYYYQDVEPQQAFCPEGYTFVDEDDTTTKALQCMLPRSNSFSFYSEYICGSYRECDENIIFNLPEEKCSYTLCPELPSGWTNDPGEGIDFEEQGGPYCPYDDYGTDSSVWVHPSDLDCEDPCSAASTCSDCILGGCTWSHENEMCSVFCFGGLSSDEATAENAEELCEDLFKVYHDSQLCDRQESCDNCTSTTLPSDPARACRWIRSYGSERCTANTCQGTCTEIHECSDNQSFGSHSCSACLLEGCVWSAMDGCFHTCPDYIGGEECISLASECYGDLAEEVDDSNQSTSAVGLTSSSASMAAWKLRLLLSMVLLGIL